MLCCVNLRRSTSTVFWLQAYTTTRLHTHTDILYLYIAVLLLLLIPLFSYSGSGRPQNNRALKQLFADAHKQYSRNMAKDHLSNAFVCSSNAPSQHKIYVQIYVQPVRCIPNPFCQSALKHDEVNMLITFAGSHIILPALLWESPLAAIAVATLASVQPYRVQNELKNGIRD